eukprot:m.91837 g.91837  ORF g.91837 m.91837 type:complete len:426 (+) comp9929_c0_seq1:268-1545(+)
MLPSVLVTAVVCTSVPRWTPTYNMSESTVVMPCNYSGLYDFDVYPELARFGLVDYDWSNSKGYWVDQSPMNCEEMLVDQAARNKALNPTAKVFVYRNIVKALPWYVEVREKLADPQWWGFFLPYKGCRDNTTGAYLCGDNATVNLYHDHEQTPGWPGGGNGGPDGICHGNTQPPWDKGCDCGKDQGILCGEYLFDHRNESLQAWLTDQYMGGKDFGLGNPNVDGFYLDDNWSSRGPSEEDSNCTEMMGLSKQDVQDLVAAWSKNMAACQQTIVDMDGFNWQLFDHASTPSASSCAKEIRAACEENSTVQTSAMQYGISYKFNHDFSNGSLTNFNMDLAYFLMTRGDYAWLGYGWMGCGCGWEHNGKMPCDIYQRPSSLDIDYGTPQGLCKETSANTFTREWTKSTITIDCNHYTSTITMKPDQEA